MNRMIGWKGFSGKGRWKRWLRKLPPLLLATGLALAAVGCEKPQNGEADQSGLPDGGVQKPVTRMLADESGEGNGQAGSAQKSAPYTTPLTGLPTEKEISERPVMIMVENAPQARPQTGLDQADIVYEILAEGEITRFAAIYQSHSPKTVGPVRSIRPYFVEIGDGFDALIVHAGWSQEAMNMIAARNLEHFDEVYGDGKYYWRSNDRKMPHNLYTGIDKIRQGQLNKKLRTKWNGPQLVFMDEDSAAAPAGGSPALQADIPYIHGYHVSYKYDAASGMYLRFMDDKPHTDKESGKQLSAANVLIVESKHEIVDGDGRREVDVKGPGKGMLLQRGKAQPISWVRQGGVIRAYGGDGQELPLVPGQTWVQVVPIGTKSVIH